MASVYKRRNVDRVGHVEALDVMGDVQGRMCVLIDDEIDTAGTLCEAAKLLYQKGATEVWATATHGLFSEPAIDRLKNSNISRVVVTDTVPLPSEKQIEKIESVSVSKTFADAIRAVFEEGSVSQISAAKTRAKRQGGARRAATTSYHQRQRAPEAASDERSWAQAEKRDDILLQLRRAIIRVLLCPETDLAGYRRGAER